MILFSATVYLFILFLLVLRQSSQKIKIIFFISGVFTLSLCLLGLRISLPFSGADGVTFERIAWQWSQGSLSDIFKTINLSASYVISSITAFFYYFVGREPVVPIIINGILGLFILHYALKTFNETWPQQKSWRVVFFLMVAFSPMLTINSAIILRENYITFFLLVATFHLVRFAKTNNPISAILFLTFTLFASFFHGGAILYALGLPMYLLLSRGNTNILVKFFGVIVFMVILSFTLNYMEFGKIKEIQDSGLSIDNIAERLETIQNANTTYLQGMVPNNFIDVLWQSPIRALFFLTKPFPWDVKSFGHIIAFLDALIWVIILFTLYRNWNVIRKNQAAVAILICCIIAIFAFSYGTSNFGTAIRHRTKFYVEMLILVAPFFVKFKTRK